MTIFVWLLACRTPPTELVDPEPTPVCGVSTQLLDAPSPTEMALGTIAPVDLLSTVATASVTSAGVRIDATTRFLVGEASGLAALELGPSPESALLDGVPVDWAHTVVGEPTRQVFVLQTPLDPCTEHTLEVGYDLGLDWALGDQVRLEARPDGLFWSAGLEDASAGNFVGMWVPSNLLFDRFELTLDIVPDLAQPHVLASTGVRTDGASGWTVHWEGIQAHTPFWVLSPAAETLRGSFVAQTDAGPIAVEVHALAEEGDAKVQRAGERAVAALERFSTLFGPYGHGDRYELWIRDDQGSSMEYDGATVTAMGAIEHEILHSWFARGASPISDVDGWVDEAVTSWVTDFIPLRHHAADFALEPTLLRHGDDGWDGPRLDVTQYVFGSVIFADTAYRYSVDEVVEALGAFYQERAGASYRDVDLEEHLTCWFDGDVRDVFFHQAYGEGPAPGVPDDWCR